MAKYTVGDGSNFPEKKELNDSNKKQTSPDQLDDDLTPDNAPNLLGVGLIPTQTAPYQIAVDKENFIERVTHNIYYDISDIREMEDDSIWELLPKPLELPVEKPVSGMVFAANWSRITDYGGVTDPSKDPNPEWITDWSDVWSEGTSADEPGIGAWVERHKWPSLYTLNPTYIFYTGDPALFYTQNALSHYDEAGKGVEVDNDNIVWKLNGEEVHRGWHLSLGALARTVDFVSSGEVDGDGNQVNIVIPKPQILDVEFHNKAGMIKQQIKYLALDSDDSHLFDGNFEIDNFTAKFQGQFKVTNDLGINPADNTSEKGVEFVKDGRFGARRLWIRFVWKRYGEGKCRKRDFKRANAYWEVDGETQWTGKAEKICGRHKIQKEAFDHFPEIYKDNGQMRSKYTDGTNTVEDLTSRMVEDWTDGRKSALLYDEEADGNYYNQLFYFEKKPGPFNIHINTWIKVRKKGKKRRTYDKWIEYPDKLHMDAAYDTGTKTPKDIDLGVFVIGYEDKDW